MSNDSNAIEAEAVLDAASTEAEGEKKSPTAKPANREIKGNIPYVPSPGSITAVLDAIIISERPDKFTNNFMETVLKQTGGAARSVPPFLKKMNFLTGDGSPTELYSKFKTESGRPIVAYTGLKSAFSEIFRRHEFAHKAGEEKVKDILVEITGLKSTDQIIRLMWKSFEAVKKFIPDGFDSGSSTSESELLPDRRNALGDSEPSQQKAVLGLSYQINIILPETTDQMVYDAIFKSLKRNMLE